jgi:hypothetical protein
MPGGRFKAEEIVYKLSHADIELARDSTAATVWKLCDKLLNGENLYTLAEV